MYKKAKHQIDAAIYSYKMRSTIQSFSRWVSLFYGFLFWPL